MGVERDLLAKSTIEQRDVLELIRGSGIREPSVIRTSEIDESAVEAGLHRPHPRSVLHGIDLEAERRARVERGTRLTEQRGVHRDLASLAPTDGVGRIDGVDADEGGIGRRLERWRSGEDTDLALFGRVGWREPHVRLAEKDE